MLLLTILFQRNHAFARIYLDLPLFLDTRNHEVTMLKIKNVRLCDKYGEGEVPYEAKTGSGPVLL
jgi:integrase/recombinase XerD